MQQLSNSLAIPNPFPAPAGNWEEALYIYAFEEMLQIMNIVVGV